MMLCNPGEGRGEENKINTRKYFLSIKLLIAQVLSAIQRLTLDVDYESEEFERSALMYYKEFRDLMTQQDLSEFRCSDSDPDNADPDKSGVKYVSMKYILVFYHAIKHRLLV